MMSNQSILESPSVGLPAVETFTVGWICALHIELTAANQVLDERFDDQPPLSPQDSNCYTLGKIGRHFIVVAALPDGEYGLASAATVAQDMLRSFPNIRIGLMVGIGGGAPSAKNDIRLGDVVVSSIGQGTGGVFQYDFGKTVQDQDFRQTGFLNSPPRSLRNAVSKLRSKYNEDGHDLRSFVDDILQKKPKLKRKFKRPPPESDRLYKPDVVHPPQLEGDGLCGDTCGDDDTVLIKRRVRTEEDDDPEIHYGVIASANQLMRDAGLRDWIAAAKGILCFEMEAAGLMNGFPCLVIRGISDYSDSHKNRAWQGYASMMAAAYARDLLYQVPPSAVEAEERLKRLLHEIDNVSRQVSKIAQTSLDARSEQICDWLSPKDSEKQLKDVEPLIHPGTGNWLLKSDKYCQWKENKSRNLLCQGAAGVGKTVLSALIIKDLLGCAFGRSDQIVVHYFCRYQDRTGRMTERVLASMLAQIGRATETLPSELDDMFCKLKPGDRRPDRKDLEKAFVSLCKNYSTVYVVIDALDEFVDRSSDGKDLVEAMTLLQRQCLSIKLILTSRPGAKLLRQFEAGLVQFEEIKIEAAKEDVEQYLSYRLESLTDLDFEDSEFKACVIKEIVRAANGMFLLARLHLDNIATSNSKADVRRKLIKLNRGQESLDFAYRDTIERIQTQPPELRNLAELILLWVHKAKRSLLLGELQTAIAIDLEDKHLDREKIVHRDRMLAVCAGLVSYQSENDLVVFSHKTVSEFFDTTAYAWSQAQCDHFSGACIRYIQFYDPNLVTIPRRFRSEFLTANFPFFDYCAEFGAYHIQVFHNDSFQQEFAEMVSDNNPEQLNLIMDIALSSSWSELPVGIKTQTCQLHALAHFGLQKEIAKYLRGDAWQRKVEDHEKMKKCHPINLRAIEGSTALCMASFSGHEQVVQLLLNNGADINYPLENSYGDPPLYRAVDGNQPHIVQLLIDNGADINFRNHRGDSALYRAVDQVGDPRLVQLLLNNGAEPQMKENPYLCPLHAAALKGHEQIVRLLLEKGADASYTDPQSRGSALREAVCSGNKQVVQLLLQNGAKVNAKSEDNGGLLQAAAIGENEDILKLLLDNGADINSSFGYRATALQIALSFGNERMAQLLIEKGADLNIGGAKYGSSLTAASYGGNEQVVKLLLEGGANVNAPGGEYASPLAAASEKGHLQIARLLLQYGAKVNFHVRDAHERDCNSALQIASKYGQLQMVQLLLDSGAEVNGQAAGTDNALILASDVGHEQVVQLLLDKGANVNAPGVIVGASALQVASARGHVSVVQLLLDAGATTNTPVGYLGRGPLEIASEMDEEQIVDLLWRKGAIVNTGKRCRHLPALQGASYWGHLQIVKLLLDNGADVDTQSGKGSLTALWNASNGGHEQIVSLLLERGASVNIATSAGTALRAAKKNRYKRIVQMLLDHGAIDNADEVSA